MKAVLEDQEPVRMNRLLNGHTSQTPDMDIWTPSPTTTNSDDERAETEATSAFKMLSYLVSIL